MTDQTGSYKSEVQMIAETAVNIDRLLTEAKEMAIKLKETSDSLNVRAKEVDSHDFPRMIKTGHCKSRQQFLRRQ